MANKYSVSFKIHEDKAEQFIIDVRLPSATSNRLKVLIDEAVRRATANDWSEFDDFKIYILKKEGLTDEEIATALGVDKGFIRRRRYKLGIKPDFKYGQKQPT